jgi:pyruvate dehydrogenase E2 component (dihydrolipoamide acetyltransferase)
MELKLPELGEGVHEGELIKWKVKVGDVVKDDQPVCEIMTDKATVELPAPFHGTVTELKAKEGEVVKVGQVMLTYEGAGKSAGAPASASASTGHAGNPAPRAPSTPAVGHAPVAGNGGGHAPAPMAARSAPAPVPASSGATVGNVLAAPATRRYARESGVDLGQIQGSGPHGRVMKEDVDAWMKGGAGAVSAGAPRMARGFAPGTEERIPIRGLRKKISEKMRLSKDRAAHFTYVEEADATQLVALRNQAKEVGAKQGIKVTYLPFVMKAMVAALKQFPTMNSNIDDEKNELVVKHTFNIGLSIQTDDGLTAPVVKHVEQKSILELAREIDDLVTRARNKKLTTEDFSGGSITLTNAGSIGGLFATPIINYPEVAILGFNKIFRKPVVVKEQIVIRDWTYFSISLDHRVIDGAVAAEFMKVFIQYIENPALLILNG